jgi:multidrug resistance protein, MATE family
VKRESELWPLLKLAGPIAFAQAGYALMGLVDTAVVGRLGPAPLAAVGMANGLFFALAVIGIGATMGLDPLFAQALGAGDRLRAHELVWQGLWLSLAVTLVLSIPIAFLPFLLEPFGIPADVARDGRLFIWLRLPGLWPMLAFAALRSYLQAEQRTRAMMIAVLFANVANLLLDIALVFGKAGFPALGAAGSALATSGCNFVQLICVAMAVHPRKGVSRKLVVADLRKALKVGLPVGLQMGAEVGVFAIVGLLAARMGALSAAAHQVAIALASFTFCAATGVGMAGTVRVGRAIGAGDTPGARRAGLSAFIVGAGVMGLCSFVFWLWPEAVARILSDSPEVISASVPLLAVCAVFQLSDGIQGVGSGVLRGAGDTRFAFLANVGGHYLVGLPLAVLLGLHLGKGVIGLWWGLCAGLTAVAAGLLTRFIHISSRELRPLEGHPRH